MRYTKVVSTHDGGSALAAKGVPSLLLSAPVPVTSLAFLQQADGWAGGHFTRRRAASSRLFCPVGRPSRLATGYAASSGPATSCWLCADPSLTGAPGIARFVS